ncbi:amino acid adenylation domain-containing protein [Gelatiniphilus marinus]|uniref:Amino acid adenylation domain-containing protein n=1 Tax=Gelatiniphilus marinus TaxID=1759464 RepID=A0ABW5JPT0_9FLAO
MKKDIEKSSVLDRWKNRDKVKPTANVIKKAPLQESIPLSHGQKRLWFLQQIHPTSPFYNYSETYTFNGSLQEDSLIKGLKKVYNDHDILRTTYHIKDSNIYQKIDESAVLDISTHNLSTLTELEANAKASQIMEAQATRHFNLTKNPLVRVALIKINNQKHILLITLHHIATDKWSMRIFRDDLASHYNALTLNTAFKNKRTELQYSDYAHWLQTKKTNTKQLDYWKNKLAGEIPNLNLPTDFVRPLQPSFKGAASYTQVFNRDLSSKLLALSKQLETTPYVLMLSVYYVFLHKYTGQTDILIGSPVTNRDQKVLEELIGFFNETIVLRTKILPSTTFKDLALQVRKTTLEAFANKDVPFDVLVKELKIERSLSINPFFQAMFLYHSVPENPFFNDDLKMTHTWFDSKVSKFDLTIYISEEDGLLSSTFEYASDLFSAPTIDRFQNHFKLLLETIVKNPNERISEIPMYTATEKAFLLNKKQPVSKNFTQFNGIHNIIEDISKKHPENVALTYNGNSITYKALSEKSNQISQEVLKKSSQKEIVGLCIERSLNMIVGLLGILKAGCAYLPIDPEYPKQRINFILNDAKVSTIVTQNSLLNLFDDFETNHVLIDTIDYSKNDGTIEFPIAKETDLAYVIYTSGSTGNPKGVPITHKNIINSTAGRLDFYDENPSAFLLMSSVSFDSSKAGIFWTLCTGGNLVITKKRIEQDINKIETLIKKHNISHTLMLPSLYQLLLEHASITNLKSLKTTIVAGEACGKSLCKLHFKKLPTVNLYNEYGPTEATVWCIAHKITQEDLKYNTIPIGSPVANAEIYILDKTRNMVPYGAIGEIYIGGTGLSKTYLNRPELTEAVYIKHPINTENNKKLYKTGDLGKFRNDGAIEFLGRADYQVKIRGHRIELDEIKKAILESNLVNKAIVVTETSGGKNDIIYPSTFTNIALIAKILKDNLTTNEINKLLNAVNLFDITGNISDNIETLSISERELLFLKMKQLMANKPKSNLKKPKRIVAYITSNQDLNTTKLKAFLKNKIPDYMMPSSIIKLEEFPMLPNGKINIKALRQKATSHSNSEKTQEFKNPINAVETKLVQIWQEVLNIESISTQDNFFDIGGDSILSIQIIAKAKKLNLNLTPNQLFDNQTIAELSKSISNKKEATSNQELQNLKLKHIIGIKQQGKNAPLFCIHGGGAHFFFYNLLSKYIDKERPIYSIQASSIDADLILHDSIKQMALDFINEIKQVQPQGTYHIMAYCFSTAVGLEISRILKKEGEKVNLIIVDTVAKNQDRYATSRIKLRTAQFFIRLFKNPFKAVKLFAKSRINRIIKPAVSKHIGNKEQRKIAVLRDNQVKNYLKYNWPPYHGTITVLITEKEDKTMNQDIKNTWNEIASNQIKIVPVEGHHTTLFVDPIVKHTSKTLENCMQEFENSH